MEQQSLFKYFILTKITIFAIQFITQFLIGHVQVVIHPCTNVIIIIIITGIILLFIMIFSFIWKIQIVFFGMKDYDVTIDLDILIQKMFLKNKL